MSQQITILVLIDIPTALAENTLDNNIYFLDNLKSEGSEGEGTDKLLTAVNGFHWFDGSQACDIVLNWFPIGIGCLPLTLPRMYGAYRAKMIEKRITDSIMHIYQNSNSENIDLQGNLEEMKEIMDDSVLLKTDDAKVVDLGMKTLNIYGEPYLKGNDTDILNYLAPQIVGIRGEAVDNGIIFPSQYGSPINSYEGWYWSATIDTHKTGIYNYILDFILYKKEGDDNSWTPIPMAYEGWLKVSSKAKRNGFTHSGMGFLPII